MRLLHLTHNPPWFEDHFNFLCQQLGHVGETQVIQDYNLTADKANALWAANKDYYLNFDAIFVSHLATSSRIFLQNNWEKPLYIWLCFRFDHGIDDKPVYHNLIRESLFRTNVKFFAASEHDRLFSLRTLGIGLTDDIVKPCICISLENKVKIPCDENTFYLHNKHNETIFMNMKAELDALKIPTYQHNWLNGPPDLRGVRGVIHIPYTFLTRGWMENLALENVSFLASAQYVEDNNANFGGRAERNFFWDLPATFPGEVKLSEWYNDENKDLFVHWSSLEELRDIVLGQNCKDLIESKKSKIRVFNQAHNQKYLNMWGSILS